ncbi:HalOD1 output domain-containing protein [Natrinema halophilum]|uniref:Halobacterial output domain-containing protein n=1 Tax=Natrinema halophilum TaxID=1699371 RepID=A0A7D5GR37_9EURY|nr:HalOD1 output domain-containing protein [Natrinema halophilum]QLG48269.1 hypothetical protein HYG82_05105 [Natrinema halophilum]
MGDELFCGRYVWSSTTPTVAIVNAIAGIENVDPTDLPVTLNTALYDHIDPEALDTLVTTSNDPKLSFAIDEYRIEIDGNQLFIVPDSDW